MTQFAPGWYLKMDTSPEWIFFALGRSADASAPSPAVTDYAWQLASEHKIYRIVFELEPNVILTSHLVGQIVLLHRRAHYSGGVFRICQFSQKNYDVLQIMQLDNRFFNYDSREAAVIGHRETHI